MAPQFSGKDQILFGIWQWDLETDVCTYSPLWKSMLGYPEAEIQDKYFEWYSRVHPEDQHGINEALVQLQNNLLPATSVNYRIKDAQGEYRWMNCAIQITSYNEQQKPIRLNGVQQDINTYRKSELYLHEVNIRFSELIENYGGAVLISDENGKVFFVNKNFCGFFGLPILPYELIGGHSSDIFTIIANEFEKKNSFIENTVQCLLKKEESLNQEYRLKRGVILEQDFIPVYDKGIYKGQIWLFRDITKFKKTEEHLNFRLAFEEIITSLSTKFIQVDNSGIDELINNALALVGNLIKADRSYVFLFSADKKLMSNTHEWVNNDITPEKANLQEIPTTEFPWWMQRINRFQSILLPTLNMLPPEASGEKEILMAQQIKSLAVVPMIFRNSTLGYVGFDAVKSHRDWNQDSIKLLRILAGVITSAIKRKESEAELIRSEERYKLVSKITSDFAFAFTVTKDGRFTLEWSTGTFERITGLPISQITCLDDLLQIVHPEDKDELLLMREELVRRRSIVSEYRILKTTGEFRWISGSTILERNIRDKELMHLYITGKDITDKKLAEDRLAEERTLLRTIIDLIPDPIYVKDLYGRKIVANTAEIAILGAKNIDEVIYRSDYDFYPKEVADKTRQEDELVIKSGKSIINKEGFVITEKGEKKWFIGNKIPHLDNKGNILGLVGVSYDITERKHWEEALIQSEAKYRRVVNTIKEVIFQTDTEGNWTFLNPAWTEITGFMVDESLKTNFLEYTYEADRETNRQSFQTLISGQSEYSRHEIRYITKSGSYCWVEVYARLLHDESGEIIGTSGTLNDITARKTSEEETRRALKREMELNELKSKLVSIVSHEFRTPLAAILSSSELLQNYWDKWTLEKRSSLLQKIKKSIHNLIELLNDVTEVGRYDTGRIVLQYEQLDINGIVEELMEESLSGFPSPPRIFFQPIEPLFFKSDKKLFRQILSNLLSNAVKYTPPDKSVTISIEYAARTLIITVADEGIGIPEDEQKELFEPFMRARNAEGIQGTGLGMVILKRAIDLCNGTITFESTIDVGSTFTVTLPNMAE